MTRRRRILWKPGPDKFPYQRLFKLETIKNIKEVIIKIARWRASQLEEIALCKIPGQKFWYVRIFQENQYDWGEWSKEHGKKLIYKHGGLPYLARPWDQAKEFVICSKFDFEIIAKFWTLELSDLNQIFQTIFHALLTIDL